ncbi:Mitochondrial Carrier (MC) Family [Micractinium conductrix]|uniref:Mitochondrial Carrier (MC) Family n=1 Tax=Micractinium conductrix TaxID=554055 RepID=A0A2P6V698_9CHLO|nr:Mitochondrial Carrier (MC) Family [Micractinium conductrix]|eukprot:PSC69614.1 Mitochondrial Carrier (MC) Family [Micractinium conductrix]
MSTVTPLEHTAIGALAGVLEVSIMQPTVGVKNALQEGRPVPRTIPMLYRGVVVSAGAMLPITAVQFGMNRFLEQTYRRVMKTEQLSMGGTVALAMGAGASSAFLGCPAEFVMIQQQKAGRSLAAEARHIMAAYGPLKPMKGLSATIARESLYACGYLAVAPLLRKKLAEQEAIAAVPGAPLVLSGITAGLLATVATQPADTIKTRMQAFPDSATHPQYRSLMSTVSHIVKTEGAGTFFAGLWPRAFRIVCAVFILNGFRSTVVDAVDNHRQ